MKPINILSKSRSLLSCSLFIAVFLVCDPPFPPILHAEPQADQSEREKTRTANHLRRLRDIRFGDAVVQQRQTYNEKQECEKGNDRVQHLYTVGAKAVTGIALVVRRGLGDKKARGDFSQHRRRVRFFHLCPTAAPGI